jgi:hypothetical protein
MLLSLKARKSIAIAIAGRAISLERATKERSKDLTPKIK